MVKSVKEAIEKGTVDKEKYEKGCEIISKEEKFWRDAKDEATTRITHYEKEIDALKKMIEASNVMIEKSKI